MSHPSPEFVSAIHAAGGLVWRASPAGRELAVIRRARYGEEWTLPKGKLKPAESWEAAAVREVGEETGCTVELGAFAGGQVYAVNGRPKIVLYWHMRLVAQGPIVDTAEARQLYWLAPAAAEKQLTHASERRLVQEALPSAPAPVMRRVGAALVRQWRRLWPISALQRLEDLLPAYRHDLTHLIESTSQDGDEPLWASKARESLHEAELAVRERNPERGWRHFLAAQRFELHGLRELKPEAFRARAFTLRAEALQKLTSWRRRRVEELFNVLPQWTPWSTSEVSESEFFAALETALILHEHFGNEALKQRSARSQTRVLIGLAMGAALGWLWLLGPAILRVSAPDGRSLRWDDADLLASVLLFGLMGAAFSALISLGQAQTQTIPEQVFTYRITIARQAVGVLSALAVYVLLASEFLTVGKLAVTPALVLLAAFACGFSERLVVRALARFAGTVEAAKGDRPKSR